MTAQDLANEEPTDRDALRAALEALARGNTDNLNPSIAVDSRPTELNGTQTRSRVHLIKRDGNNRVRVNVLARYLASRILDYCIPRTLINEAFEYQRTTGDSGRVISLHRQAQELFVRLEKSGEGGELLLFSLLEALLNIPQILCKMSLKTSGQMHVHGVDGVHAKALDNGGLAVYWGESKIYEHASGAISACIESIAPYLVTEGGGAASRDILLVRDNLDAGDQGLSAQLVAYFNEHHPKSANLEVRGACLVGFSSEDSYPPNIDEALANIQQATDRWNKHVLARLKAHRLTAFEMEIFLLPFPSVAKFRSAMLVELGIASSPAGVGEEGR